MEQLKISFERELKNKLSEKTRGAQGEEQVLMKAFKYFDLNDNGVVEPDEFAKAIEKIGIQIPTKQDLNLLFNLYDTDQSGALDYKEFSAVLFGKASSTASPQKGTSLKSGGNNGEALAEKLKDKLATRGARGIIGLARQFKIMDDDNSKSLNKYEFGKAINDYMLGFTAAESATLFSYFDVDGSGTIDYNEFLRAIRGPINQNRKKIIAQVFKKLDKDGSGYIELNDIKGVYNAKNHPEVKAGKKTEEQILLEFLETFEVAHNIRDKEAPDHIVTKDEFEEYYNMISCSIDDDSYFQLMMENAWKLTEESKKGAGTKGWKNEEPKGKGDNDIFGRSAEARKIVSKEEALPENATEKQVILQIRAKIAARGARGIIGIGKKFQIADDNNTKTLDKKEFEKAMNDFRCGLASKQIGIAFNIFDRDGNGEISYEEFLRTIRGKMNPARQAIAKRVYQIMDSDRSGKVDINDIRQTYNAKRHPDVMSGKRTEEEVLHEFLETFEQSYCDQKGHNDARDGVIQLEEWLEYYNNVSMSIDDDEYFALMMNNAWNLDGKKVTKKGWGGEV